MSEVAEKKTMEYLVVAVLLGLIPAAIAKGKGHSFGPWWLYGTLIWIVALPHAILVKPDQEALEGDALTSGSRKCPNCAELIKAEAVKCRFCNSDVEAIAASCSYCLQTIDEPSKPCPAWGERRLQECADISQDPVCLRALAERGFTPSSA